MSNKVDDRSTLARTCVSLLLVLFLVLPLLLLRLGSFPVSWYDEGVNTHTASTYAAYRVYGTFTVKGVNPFDPVITTGPTVLLPVAWMFSYFGPGLFQARVIITLYAILAIILLYNLYGRIYGMGAALFATLTFLLVPALGDTGFVLLGRQLLGETASFAFILLGLTFLLKEWDRRKAFWGLFSGLAFGFASISKLQSSIPVVATLVVLTVGRFIAAKPKQELRILTAPLLTLLMIATWFTLQNTGYATSFQVENQQASFEAIKLLILPGFWQRGLSRTGFIILAGMTLAVISCIRTLNRHRDMSSWTRSEWYLLALGVMTLASGAWWSILSIGWVRYAYFGWMTALVVLSRDVWLFFLQFRDRFFPKASPARRLTYPLAIAGLSILILIFHALPLLRAAERDDAQAMAEYIRYYVDRDEVIESWDWQLDALSEHRNYNHPPQSLLLSATRQRFLENTAFDLKYDLMQADPDFLLTGPFSIWTRVYDQLEENNLFVEVVRYGPYTLWSRTSGLSVR